MFEESPNKVAIRRLWDLSIIQQWSEKLNCRLSYFGLPGPAIADILDWRPYLGYCTAIERLRKEKKQREEDLNVHRLIHKNVILNDIDEFQLLLGDIEDIILYGEDQVRVRPRLSTNEHPLVASFQYDLLNLDFLGGMGHLTEKRSESTKSRASSRQAKGSFPMNSNGKTAKIARRVQALQKILERQSRKNTLLILTLNVRDNIDDYLVRYLEGAQHEIADRQLGETLNWYAARQKGMKEYRLKATVPLFIRREGEVCGFDCFCYPPIAYTGSGSARMVHFAFELTDTNTILHAHSQQRIPEVVNLPLLEVNNSVLQMAVKQHPNFKYACDNLFDFLPKHTQSALLASIIKKSTGVLR